MNYPIQQIDFVKTETLHLPMIRVVLDDRCDMRIASALFRRGYSKQSREVAHGMTQVFFGKNFEKDTDVVTEMHFLTRVFGIVMFPTEQTNASLDTL
jgi:hypothetical protein